VKTASQKLTSLVSKAERVEFLHRRPVRLQLRHPPLPEQGLLPDRTDLQQALSWSLSAAWPARGPRRRKPTSRITSSTPSSACASFPTVSPCAPGYSKAGWEEGSTGRIWDRTSSPRSKARDVWTNEKDEGISPFLLRAFVSCDLFWGFYLQVGADDLLDHPAPMAGGGLRLRDDDIKALIGLAGLGS